MAAIAQFFNDIYTSIFAVNTTNETSIYDPHFPDKPNFSYMNKPDPHQFINKIHNEFVRNILNNNLDILRSWNVNRFYPLYLIATEWKIQFGSDLTDQMIIKDILTNIYSELFPIAFKYNNINNNNIFYQTEINTRDFFGSSQSGENIWSLTNDTLIDLYLEWIHDQIVKCHQCQPNFPFRLTISTRTESQPPIEFMNKIYSKYNEYPSLNESLDNPFVNGNTIYIKN